MLETNMLYAVNEIFHTIQGEAKFTGTPAIFIRMQGCKVGCSWCDTKHTWTKHKTDIIPQSKMIAKESDGQGWSYMSSEQMLAEIEKLLENKKRYCHVVITGGEPLEQNIDDLVSCLSLAGHCVQLETSGTQPLSDTVKELCWVTVSPKINMAGGMSIVEDTIKHADEIKHPVGKVKDIENLKGITGMQNKSVWLQPLSENKKATRLCVEACMLYGWRLSIQTHKQINIR